MKNRIANIAIADIRRAMMRLPASLRDDAEGYALVEFCRRVRQLPESAESAESAELSQFERIALARAIQTGRRTVIRQSQAFERTINTFKMLAIDDAESCRRNGEPMILE